MSKFVLFLTALSFLCINPTKISASEQNRDDWEGIGNRIEMRKLGPTLTKSFQRKPSMQENSSNEAELKKLKQFYFKACPIYYVLSSMHFRNIKNLKALDLSFSKLESLPDSIGLLKDLKRLNLSRNNLKSLPESLSQLESLRELDISDYRGEVFPEVLGQLPGLVVLEMSNAAIKNLPDAFANLTDLLIMHSNGVKIESVSLKSAILIVDRKVRCQRLNEQFDFESSRDVLENVERVINAASAEDYRNAVLGFYCAYYQVLEAINTMPLPIAEVVGENFVPTINGDIYYPPKEIPEIFKIKGATFREVLLPQMDRGTGRADAVSQLYGRTVFFDPGTAGM